MKNCEKALKSWKNDKVHTIESNFETKIGKINVNTIFYTKKQIFFIQMFSKKY